ncbi:hypothetical protein SADUNF_Sadunf16G0250300 [Salix dunnii]|uniref:Small ribosomal subunit protein uS14m n=1 Tax=Salix dunnii TaxID=1413687 RepID=A0A835JE09_9ROSI|nr:hypothetical protein SADUNF_Sadunf16G0250300 [Salix dunnii]
MEARKENRNIRDNHRRMLAEKFELRRNLYRALVRDPTLPQETRELHACKLAKLPRNSSFTRVRNRCVFTGRPRGVYQLFRMSRLVFRSLASQVLIQLSNAPDGFISLLEELIRDNRDVALLLFGFCHFLVQYVCEVVFLLNKVLGFANRTKSESSGLILLDEQRKQHYCTPFLFELISVGAASLEVKVMHCPVLWLYISAFAEQVPKQSCCIVSKLRSQSGICSWNPSPH